MGDVMEIVGFVVSTVIVMELELGLVLPAASVAVASNVCAPSDNEDVTIDQEPPVAVAEPVPPRESRFPNGQRVVPSTGSPCPAIGEHRLQLGGLRDRSIHDTKKPPCLHKGHRTAEAEPLDSA